MTFDTYVAQRPDLMANWENAHRQYDDDDGSHYEDDSQTADWIRSFGSFEDYVIADHGGGFDAFDYVDPPPPPPVSPFFDQTHRSIGIRNGVEFFILVDEGGDVISFDQYGGSIANLGHANQNAATIASQLYQNVSPPVVTQPPVVTVTPPVVTPPYVPPVSGGNPGVNLPPTGVSPFFDPTHRLIGQTAAGPVYMLIDEGGMIIIWIEGANGMTGLRQGGRATKSAALTASELSQAMAGSGGGPTVPPRPVTRPGTTPGTTPGPGVNLPPGGASPNFDPTHRLVGYTRDGFEVYRLTDEGGHLVEWYDIPGQGAQGQHYLTGPNDPSSYIFSTSRPTTPTIPAGPSTGSGAGQSQMGTVALIAGAAAIAFFLGRRK